MRLSGRAFASGLIALSGMALMLFGVVVFVVSGPRAPRSFGASDPELPRRAATASADRASAQPTRSSRPAPQPFLPSSVRISSLHVDAPVQEILGIDGQLIPPQDPGEIGWWAGSRLPGSTVGTTVFVGHVDSAQSGPGALFELRDIDRGAAVSVLARGRRTDYVIDSLTYYPKTKGLPADLFTASGKPRLILISCGGTFDQTALSYRDNLVAVGHSTG